jgi:hypothetical protein
MRKHTSLAVACGLLLLAAGCGGGGGGDSTVYPLTDALRSYQVGDQWVYSVIGTWKGPLGSTIPMYGTVTRSMSTMTMGGSNYLGVTVFRNLLPQSGIYQERRYTLLRQDTPTPSVRAVGDKKDTGYWRMVIDNPKPVTVPGAWSVGYSFSSITHYENGEHSDYAFAVQGTEIVATQVGAFATYQVAVTEEDPKYGTSTRKEWWHPGLGAPVKYTERCVIPGGATLDYTATLTSRTVSVP